MKFQYTEAGRQELRSFQEKQQAMLEKIIEERKFVFGDDIIEVTASDVREASRLIHPVRTRTNNLTTILAQVYILLGTLVAIGGVFYPYVMDIIATNKMQANVILAGVGTTLLGLALRFFTRLRYTTTDMQMSREQSERLRLYKRLSMPSSDEDDHPR